jgi:5'-methylthioadenosine/S-adenosylhomocysteine nucleosidase
MMLDARNILILAALREEEEALLGLLASGGSAPGRGVLHEKLGLAITTASRGDRAVSVVRTGVGSVNAALALALARERAPVDAVVLLGVGGALREDLDVGDFVISSRVLQHDYYYSFDHGDQRIRPGALILSSEEASGHVPDFAADPRLIEWLERAQPRGQRAGARVLKGTILSGNEFVGRPERKRSVASLSPDALLVEMEAAGVAQVAHALGIPFVVGKTVADRLNPDGSIESDFRACLAAACEHAAAALHSLL